MEWDEINGRSVRYQVGGDGPPLVLVHEIGGSLESWEAVAPQLERHFRVLRFDLRGCGQSERIRSVTLDEVVDDLTALTDRVGMAWAHVAGCALGGGIALAYAARRGERVASAVAASPVTEVPAGAATFLSRIRHVADGGMRVAAGSLDRSFPPEVRHDPRLFERFRLRWLANDPTSFVALCELAATLKIRPELPSIAAPTLLIAGLQDVIRSPEMTREIASDIPGAHLAELETGHFMHLQSPQLFASVLTEFIASGGARFGIGHPESSH